jgi:hypothetical protein
VLLALRSGAEDRCRWCSFHVELERGSITLGDDAVTLKYDEPTPSGYEGKLDFYLSCGSESKTRWYSCSKCHIFLFTTHDAWEEGQQDGCTVSLRCLDLTPSGTTLKELTRSEVIRYDDLQSEQERNRHGEPFEGGEW